MFHFGLCHILSYTLIRYREEMVEIPYFIAEIPVFTNKNATNVILIAIKNILLSQKSRS